MTFGDLRNLVLEKVVHDGASTVGLDVTSTSFSNAVIRGIDEYVSKTKLIYSERVSFPTTLTAGSSTLNILSSTKIFMPRRLWLNGKEIQRASSLTNPIEPFRSEMAIPSSAPRLWSNMPFWGGIRLDAPLDTVTAASTTHAASGWAIHPTIQDANSDVVVPEDEVQVLAEFIAIDFMKPAVGDTVSAARLAAYQANAEVKMQQFLARNLRMWIDT